MKQSTIKKQILDQIDKLPTNMQLRILDFTRALTSKGVEGKSLLRFEGAISREDLERMTTAIEESCEKINVSEW